MRLTTTGPSQKRRMTHFGVDESARDVHILLGLPEDAVIDESQRLQPNRLPPALQLCDLRGHQVWIHVRKRLEQRSWTGAF